MSATGRGKERRDHDYYPTPTALAVAFVRLLQIRPGQRVLEPSAGDAARFVRAVKSVHGVDADAVELRREAESPLRAATDGNVWIGDFLRYGRKPEQRGYDWVIGNPPFEPAAAHVQHALFLCRPGGRVAFVLRSGFLHPQVRAHLRRFAWRSYEMEERPGFLAELGAEEADQETNATDATEYAGIVWQRDYDGDLIRRYFSWKDPGRSERDIAAIRSLDWVPGLG